MKKIIYINSCIKGKESRTGLLANNILKSLKGVEIEEINLSSLNLLPYTESNNPVYHPIEERFFEISSKLAKSDGIVISAPFWDMSFPALLKVFLEKLSLPDIMFKDDGETCLGISNCPFMFYVTTRGMDIPDGSHLEQATPYLKALCELWGIQKFDYVSVFNCDYISSQELNLRIKQASELGKIKINQLIK